MKIGLVLGGGDNTLDEAVEAYVRAERDGFASAWQANIFGMDALTVLAMAGRATKRIELGVAVVPTYPRHPHALAQQAATVNVVTGGRLALGIGRSHQLVIEGMFGLSYDKPLTHMREYLTVLRSLINEGNCSLEGKQYRVNASLSIAGASPFPILIGALMPGMLKICGELCDGTLTWMTGPKTLEQRIVPLINAAASGAGRPAPRVICSLPVCVTDQPDAARETAARIFEHYGYLPVYRACLDEEGAAGPADVAVVGSEDEVRAGLERVRDAGATDFYGNVFKSGASGEDSTRRTYDFLASLGGGV
ncbi:MAG: LLM class F420-dependent oxidoreductase [Candidatus Binatia bacterium]